MPLGGAQTPATNVVGLTTGVVAASSVALFFCLALVAVLVYVVMLRRSRAPIARSVVKEPVAFMGGGEDGNGDGDGGDEAMLAPPTGNVAFVFTRIAESALLWELYPEAMEILLESHADVIRTALGEVKGGYEVKLEADAFMLAFHDAQAAIQFCLAAREGLASYDWKQAVESQGVEWPTKHAINPKTEYLNLSVSMGVHCGPCHSTVDERTQRMDYYGQTVNRAARVASHLDSRGAITVSEDALSEARGLPGWASVEAQCVFRYEGPQRFKGIDEEIVVYTSVPTALGQDELDAAYVEINVHGTSVGGTGTAISSELPTVGNPDAFVSKSSLSEMGGGGGEDEEEGEESDSTSGLLSEERPRAVISRKSASRLADARSRERTTASRASRALKTRAGRSDGNIGGGGGGSGGGRNRLMTASPDRVHDIVRQRSKSPASLSPTVSDPPKSARGLLAVAAQVSHKHSESLGALEGGAGTPKRRSRVRSSRSSRSLRSARSSQHVPSSARSTHSLSRRRSGMKRRKQSLGVIRSSSHLAVPGRRSSASLAPPVEVGDLDAVLASSPELVEADFAGVGLNRSFSASALDR